MRKGFLAICLVLVVLLAALAPSCAPTTGNIVVQATRCGVPWQGAVNYTLTPGSGSAINGTSVQFTHGSLAPGTWTCAYVAGGPAGAFLNSTQPSVTQSLSAGGTITFTLVFELNQDAAIQWLTWTLNGVPHGQPSTVEVGPCNVTDVHFQQWVNGCVGYNVTLNETDWLTITASPANPPGPVFIYVVNADCALNKTPTPQGLPAIKKSQVPSINNVTAQVGDNITVGPMLPPAMLDVHTGWQFVKGTNYTKSINWLGISKAPFDPMHPPHPCVLFELVAPPGFYQFTLVASAHVDLVGATDVNMTNNDAMGPQLILNVVVPQ
jgi:hypothetical protein